ncbi:MAG: ribonuclease HII [Clostridium sp.]|nr:ribonuclease HII [Clostridium sp.]
MNWLEYENEAYNDGFEIVCGIDEAGRGPLAGPVYAAAVILPKGYVVEGVNDSKKLSEKKRDALFDKVVNECVAYSVGIATEQEIDEINILHATFLAMRRAVGGLSVKPDIALIDGNKTPGLDIEQRAIVKGDGKSANIAAASIIAKVSRDRYMLEMAEKYPEYQFEKHKGYGTKLHYKMLEKYGASPIHRVTFLKKFYEQKEK